MKLGSIAIKPCMSLYGCRQQFEHPKNVRCGKSTFLFLLKQRYPMDQEASSNAEAVTSRSLCWGLLGLEDNHNPASSAPASYKKVSAGQT